jgi:hypothetical protein
MRLPKNDLLEWSSIPTLVTVIRTLRGGSQSRLVLCSDKTLYVLKTHPHPQGPNVLANEAIGTTLLRGLGFPAPPWKPIRLNLKAVRLFPDLATTTSAGVQSPACGLHFGSEYLGGPNRHVFDFIPQSTLNKLRTSSHFVGIYLFDIWANHQDERQCVFHRTTGESTYEKTFIDNGHLFGGPRWFHTNGESGRPSSLLRLPIAPDDPAVEYWLNIFESRIPGLLAQAISAVPHEWRADNIGSLFAYLISRLASLRTLVQYEMCCTT